MLRRILAALRTPTLSDLLAQDLEEARRGLREATLAGEAWESREVLYRGRIARLEGELQCSQKSKSKAASSEDGPSGEWDAAYAVLGAGANGLSSGDLSRGFTYERSHAGRAANAPGASESQAASSPPRASFLKGLGKRS